MSTAPGPAAEPGTDAAPDTSDLTVPLSRPMIGDEERAAVDRVLRSGQIGQGPEVADFEAEFSRLVGDRDCVAVNSGTSALHVALAALGIGRGDEVVVPSFTFAATANAVRLCGAEPVLVDIDRETFCVDPAAIDAAVGPRTAALIAVHLFGHPADMTAIAGLAARHRIAVVEDAAQAHGARWEGAPVGALGDAAAFSFYPTKNMTTGEGGMVVLADGAAARIARLLRNQGMEVPYRNEIVGMNLRMTDLAAAIGRVQLRRLPAFTESRRRHARLLDAGLAGTGLGLPVERASAHHVYHQYTVRSADRDGLRRRLAGRGVESRAYYPTPVHRLAPFDIGQHLPVAEQAAVEVLSLPVGPHLSDADVTQVVEAVIR